MFDHWKPEDLLKAIALVGAAIAFAIGLVQHPRNTSDPFGASTSQSGTCGQAPAFYRRAHQRW